MNREDSAKVGGWLDHAAKMARTVAEHNAEETIAALTAERDNALAALRRRSSQRDQLDARCEQLFIEREQLRAVISSVRAVGRAWLASIEMTQTSAEADLALALTALDSSGTPEPEAEIWIDRGRMGGLPCVYGSRVPIETLVRYAEHDNDEVALEAYPSATAQTLAAARWFLTQWRRVDSSGTVEDAPEERADCGCPIEHRPARILRHTRECSDRQAVERARASLADLIEEEEPPSAQLPEERSDEKLPESCHSPEHCQPGHCEDPRWCISAGFDDAPVDGETP